MTTIMSVLCVVLSVVIIFLVLMHSGKDAGLSGAFGVGTGAGPLGGGSLVERNLNRWTIALCLVWVVVIVLLVKEPW
jgi:preprotein translocase subunit SecG